MKEQIAALQRTLLRSTVLQTPAYAVADSRGLIKLDAMENPWGLPAELRPAWLETLADIPMNRYPPPHPHALIEALREQGQIAGDQGMMLGNGSDELIQILITAIAGSGRPVMALEPSFVMYRLLSQQLGVPFTTVDLDDDFALDRDAFLAHMAATQPALVFIDSPNNPSGRCFAATDLEAICAAAPGLVVVDEAYAAFSSEHFADRLGHYPNLLLLRTLSKAGLAGLRLGFLAGPAAWVEQLDKLRLPYNINILTQRSVAFALQHQRVLDLQAAEIRSQREQLYGDLQSLGLRVWPSQANFLLFQAPGRAAEIHQGLKSLGILIKAFTGHPRLADHLRVSIGTPEENRAFFHALESLR